MRNNVLGECVRANPFKGRLKVNVAAWLGGWGCVRWEGGGSACGAKSHPGQLYDTDEEVDTKSQH